MRKRSYKLFTNTINLSNEYTSISLSNYCGRKEHGVLLEGNTRTAKAELL